MTYHAELLADHPAIHPERDSVANSRWLVTRLPSRWLRWCCAPTSMVVEVRPHFGGHRSTVLIYPTARPAPRWAVRALELGQFGLLTSVDLQPKQLAGG